MIDGAPEEQAHSTRATRPVLDLSRRWLAILFLVALAMRAGWGAYRLAGSADPNAREFPDEVQYWRMAESLSAGEGLRDEFGFTATRMPLYPGWLSLFVSMPHGVVCAKVAQWLIGSLAAVFVAGMATRLLNDRRVGLLAGLLVALDPFFVFFSSLLLTETFFITLLAAWWWIAAPVATGRPVSIGRWLAMGALGAVCVYARESALGLILLAIALCVLLRGFERRTIRGAAVAVALIVIFLLPWGWRNQRALGDWVWLTTRGGVSLYDGVRPGATGASDLADIQQMPAVRGVGELEWHRYFLAESFRAIRENPRRIMALAPKKLARMWNPFPNVDAYQSGRVRAVSAGWSLPIFVFALAGIVLVSRRSKGAMGGFQTVAFLLLPAIYLTVLHSLFVGSVRYRLGAMPMLEILAASAIMVLVDRLTLSDTKRVNGG